MSANQSSSVLLSISAAPFWHCGRTTAARSRDQIIALMPAAAMAVYTWGLPAARVMALSVATCAVVEYLCCQLMKRRPTVVNWSCAVYGLLFAFLLPAAAPWWLVMLGAACCMVFGEMLFGGLGNCPVSTPLVGWAILFVSFPLFMDPNVTQLSTSLQDPLCVLRYFGVERANSFSLMKLLIGQQIAPLGAGQPGALVLGGIFLMARGFVRMEIVGAALVGFLFPFLALSLALPGSVAGPLFQLGTGSAVLCIFFLAPECSVSPSHTLGMLLYGLVVGLLMFAIRTFGSYADGAPFAVLLASLLTPYFDMVRPKPFGVR